MGVTTYGISLDSVATQEKFARQHDLGFGLLSDPDGSAASKYQVLAKGSAYAKRVTFVIDPKGKIRAIERSVNVNEHGSDLAELIESLQE